MKKPVVTESKAPISNDEKCLKTEPVNGDVRKTSIFHFSEISRNLENFSLYYKTPVATANQSAIVISFNKPDDVPSLTNGVSIPSATRWLGIIFLCIDNVSDI